jgi:four helix bundle protein
MTSAELKQRTQRFALDLLDFVDALPRTRRNDVIGRQLLRSGTSIGANYRAACRARSKREFVAKLGIVEEEADESGFWLELIQAGRPASTVDTVRLLNEANELTAIIVASIKTIRDRNRR